VEGGWRECTIIMYGIVPTRKLLEGVRGAMRHHDVVMTSVANEKKEECE